MEVLFHPAAEADLARLAPAERAAMHAVLEKLEALGPRLPFPHQSAVKAGQGLRELRPRAGRSRWRAMYRQIGHAMVILAVGPEAEVDSKGFNRAVKAAAERFAEIEPPPKKKTKAKTREGRKR